MICFIECLKEGKIQIIYHTPCPKEHLNKLFSKTGLTELVKCVQGDKYRFKSIQRKFHKYNLYKDWYWPSNSILEFMGSEDKGSEVTEYTTVEGRKLSIDDFVLEEHKDWGLTIMGAEKNNKGELVGTTDWAFVDTGIQGEFTSKDNLLNLLSFLKTVIKRNKILKDSFIKELPLNKERSEAFTKSLGW